MTQLRLEALKPSLKLSNSIKFSFVGGAEIMSQQTQQIQQTNKSPQNNNRIKVLMKIKLFY